MPGEILRPDFKKTEKNKSREIGSSFSLKDENIARKIATRSLEREGHDFFYYINLDEQEENEQEKITALANELREDGSWQIISKTEDPNPLNISYTIININALSTFFSYHLLLKEEDLVVNKTNVVNIEDLRNN